MRAKLPGESDSEYVWDTLLARCINCGKRQDDHVNGACLFRTTKWKPHAALGYVERLRKEQEELKMSHFVIKCHCGAIIEQCRCASPNKTVTYEMCDACKKANGYPARTPPAEVKRRVARCSFNTISASRLICRTRSDEMPKR